MKTTATRTILITIAASASLAFLCGCQHVSGGPPTRTGFLSSYNHLEKVDDTTWRYVNKDRLRSYKKFHLMPVAVLAADYKGEPITAEQRQKVADYIRQALILALGDRYPVVAEPGTDVAEARVALTSVFKKGLRAGFTLEGEILDSYSAVQVAAVTRSEIGEAYVGSWWDAPSLRGQVDAWAKQVRQALDQVNQ